MYDIRKLYIEGCIQITEKSRNSYTREYFQEIVADLMDKGIYLTAPIFLHKINTKNSAFQVILPIGKRPQMAEEMQYEYFETIRYRKCYFTRKLVEENSVEQELIKLEKFLKKKETHYDEIYVAIITIPGGFVADIYIPIVDFEDERYE